MDPQQAKMLKLLKISLLFKFTTMVYLSLCLLACDGNAQVDSLESHSQSQETPKSSTQELAKTTFKIPALKLKPTTQPKQQRISSPLKPDDSAGLLKLATSVYTEPGGLPNLEIDETTLKEALNTKLTLKDTRMSAEISGTIAQVQVRQVYANHSEKPLNVTYTFPLPENAAVDDMRMVIGERVITAEIKKREEARKIFEVAKSSGKTAALLEQQRPNVFTQSVANIAPGHEIEIMTHYVQQLTYDQGEYEFVFPMVVGDRFTPGPQAQGLPGDKGWISSKNPAENTQWVTPAILGAGNRSGRNITIDLLINAGQPLSDLSTPTHETLVEEYDEMMFVQLNQHDQIPNRDFVVRYRVSHPEPQISVLTHADPKAQGERSGGFVNLVIHPPALDVEQEVGRREFIFVMDVSGSMWGKPLLVSKNIVNQALNQMRPVDVFNIITFSGSTGKLFSEPRPANHAHLKLATQYISSMGAGGGTMMQNAIKESLSSDVTPGYHRYVFFLTDGFISNEQEIGRRSTQLIKRLKAKGQKAKVFGMGIGENPNRHLIDMISKSGKGAAIYAHRQDESLRAVNQFYQMIDLPVITDLQIDWGGLKVNELTPHQLPDLFATRPLVLNARYQGEGEGVITVKGKRNQKPFELKLPLKLPQEEQRNSAIATLWARNQVESFERYFLQGRAYTSENGEELQKRITQLGLDFHIVTHYTSLVAVDDQTTTIKIEEPQSFKDDSYKAPRRSLMKKSSSAPNLELFSGDSTGFIGGIGRGTGGGGFAGNSYGLGGGGIQASSKVVAKKGYGEGTGLSGKRMRKKSKVRMLPPQIKDSGLDPKVIRRVVLSRSGAYQNCYERQLQYNPTLQGRIKFSFYISNSGRVLLVKQSESTLKDNKVGLCMIKHLQKLRFPASKDGKKTKGDLPFIFTSRFN